MNIEELIKSKKNQLDVEDPPAELWGEIKNDWKPERRFSWWKAAAAVFLAISIGLLIQNLSLQDQMNQMASLGDISDEYRTIERSYITQINDLESQIEIDQARNEEDFKWIFEEMETLDEVNSLYRQDIGKIDDELLVGILIDHYEKKIKLLKRLDLEIKRTQKFKTDEETNTRSINL
ncbi:hypothetical protein [Ekhidna sp.]